jgi:hypothetical protein
LFGTVPSDGMATTLAGMGIESTVVVDAVRLAAKSLLIVAGVSEVAQKSTVTLGNVIPPGCAKPSSARNWMRLMSITPVAPAARKLLAS